MTDVWPRDILVPRNVAVNYRPRTLMGPSAISGFQQAVASDAGVWQIDLLDIPVPTPAKVLKWREMALLLEGRLNPVLVPVYEADRAPWPLDRLGKPLVPASVRDRTLDGTAFADDEIPDESEIIASVFGLAPMRATQIVINVDQGGDLAPGHFFRIGERLYQIRRIVGQVARRWTVDIRPPLREAAHGQPVDFMRPHCKCRLMGDGMELQLAMNRWGFPSVSFLEDVS